MNQKHTTCFHFPKVMQSTTSRLQTDFSKSTFSCSFQMTSLIYSSSSPTPFLLLKTLKPVSPTITLKWKASEKSNWLCFSGWTSASIYLQYFVLTSLAKQEGLHCDSIKIKRSFFKTWMSISCLSNLKVLMVFTDFLLIETAWLWLLHLFFTRGFLVPFPLEILNWFGNEIIFNCKLIPMIKFPIPRW